MWLYGDSIISESRGKQTGNVTLVHRISKKQQKQTNWNKEILPIPLSKLLVCNIKWCGYWIECGWWMLPLMPPPPLYKCCGCIWCSWCSDANEAAGCCKFDTDIRFIGDKLSLPLFFDDLTKFGTRARKPQ